MDRKRTLRRVATDNAGLTLVLCVAAVLLYVGIWRTGSHQFIPDEVAATTQPFLLVRDGLGLTKFEKGGNFHVWLLALAYVPVVLVLGAYWLATGQFWAVLAAQEELTAHTAGGQWAAADPRLLDAYYLLVTAGRFVSATAGLLTVLAVALLARRLYNRPAGVVAGATLTCSLGFTLTAKFATEDVIAACLVAWTLVLLADHYRTGSSRPLLVGAGLAGLAISAKATTGLLVVPVAALALRQYDHDRLVAPRWSVLWRLTRYPTVAVAAYVSTTPSLLLNPDDYVAELARYTSVRAGDATYYATPDSGVVAHLGHLATALGGPLFLLALVATGSVALLTATGRLHPFTWYLLCVAVPYFVVISVWSNVQYNRVLLLLPFLAVFVGGFVSWAGRHRRLRRVVGPVVLVVLVLSFTYTASGVMAWGTSREAASAWTHENLDASDDVTTLGKPLYLPTFPPQANVTGAVVDPLYHRHEATRKQQAIASVACGRTEYVVLTSFHYERYFEDPSVAPNRTRFYRSLLDETDYRVVATFGPESVNREKSATDRFERAFRLVPPSRNTNNPRILVLARTAPPESACTAP